MRICVSLLIGIVGVATIVGCGGSGGSIVVSDASVSITASGLSPRDFSLARGGSVTWTNNTSRTVKIVSGGILVPSPSTDECALPPPLPDFTIAEDGSFTPTTKNLYISTRAVLWSNLSSKTVELHIIDETGTQIFCKDILKCYVDGCYFSRVGEYTFYLSDTPETTCTFTLSGTPDTDGKFESPYLSPGQSYSTVVNQEGQYQDYCVIDQADPYTSHMSGSIAMQ